MLYFLAALQFSSAYEEINVHIGTVLHEELSVADSTQKDRDNKLSAENMKEYVRASCAFSSCVLGLIQGPGASQSTSDPWLFELFCNSAFDFKYPSGTALFSKVSNYAYALQFQLIFLYSMCGNIGVKCGWQHCTYGSEINKNSTGSPLQSHICPGLTCGGLSGCKHNGTGNGTNCKHSFHPTSNNNPTCGKATNCPLQAFLTDCINGLCRSHPTNSTSHLSTCSGALCHVPMGFQATHLRQNAANGVRVYLVLKSICGGVLPLLYRYGFTFGSTGALFGESKSETKRNCANFHSQLQSVINGNPLNKLLESIDDFLFLFRYYFLGNLSTFWSIYIGLILYTFFFLLDTLHFRSHLRLTSHTVPPLSLLTSGKPLPTTKLAYITQ